MEAGKKVCKELKAVRKQIADANDIEFTPNECKHKGDCPGTCPACEEEVRYLEQELGKRSKLGKTSIVAGLSIAVAACASSCGSPKGAVAYSPDSYRSNLIQVGNDTGKEPSPEVMLQGDVVKVEIEQLDTIQKNDSVPKPCPTTPKGAVVRKKTSKKK